MASVTILSDNGATSGSAGLKTSGGNDGVLLLQTTTSGGTPTTAISISNTQVVTYTNQPTYTGGTANGVLYLNGSKAVTSGTALVFDGTNLGVGVTPSANSITGSGYRQIEIGTSAGNMLLAGAQEINLVENAYYNSGWKYAQSTYAASYYRQYSGQHQWYNAPSGTAGNTISFTQAMTLDASGNLLVGTTTQQSNALVSLLKSQNAASPLIALVNGNAGNSSRSAMFLTSDTAAAQIGVVSSGWAADTNLSPNEAYIYNTYGIALYTSSASQPIRFLTNSSERARFNAGAPVLCLAGGNTSATGTGIAFPATQNASSDANTLDDYEEGTWTPTLVATGAAFTSPAFSGIARYVKIGRIVNVMLGGTFTFSGNGTGDFAISGLPFTSYNPGGATPSGGASPLLRYVTWTGDFVSDHVRANTTNIEFWGVANGGSYTRVPCSGLVSGFEMYYSHYYEASA